MKFYFFVLLFFCTRLFQPISALSSENSQTPSDDHLASDQVQAISKSVTTTNVEQVDVPDLWTEHVEHEIEHESDTFPKKFFNMLVILLLLIGFMLLASWALKRMMKTKITQLNTSSSIKILETRYLSPRATLYLLEFQNQTCLIAESPTTVTYLTSFPLDGKNSSFSLKNR